MNRSHPMCTLSRTIGLATALLLGARAAAADSVIVAPAPGYQANDRFTTSPTGGDLKINSFDVSGNLVANYGSDFLTVLDRTTGSLAYSLGAPTDYFLLWDSQGIEVYNSFTRFAPDGNSVWVGFSTYGNGDDRIYQLDLATGTWSHEATLNGAFDLEFRGGVPYVSGLNSTSWTAPTGVWLLDTTDTGGVPNNNHDKIAELPGSSTGIAFDAGGNLYVATSVLDFVTYQSSGELLKFASGDLDTAIGAANLTSGDATKLSDLPHGAYDTEVDDAGNVLFDMNVWAGPTSAAMWDGIEGPGSHFNLIAEGIGADGNFLTFLGAFGNLAVDGTVFVADGSEAGYPGLAEINGLGGPGPVGIPEPATAVLAAIAAGALLLGRRHPAR